MSEISFFGVGFMIFSLIPLLGGLFVANLGRKTKNRSKRIKETETTEISELQPGTVEVKGKARPTEEDSTFLSPINRDEVLATKVMVERYESHGSETGGGGWKTIHEEKQAVPFIVDDGTGEVRVEPPSSSEQQMLAELNREKVPGGQEPPETIREFVERESEIDETSNTSVGPLSLGERRRYSEGSIQPGEEVYVLGRAREEDAGWGESSYVIGEPTASGDFIMSDKPEEQLIKEGKWGGLLLYVVGGISAFVGGLLLLVSLLFFL